RPNDLVKKLLRAQLQKLGSRLQNQHVINTQGLDEVGAVGHGGQDRLKLLRAKELQRMRIERHRDGRNQEGTRPPYQLIQQRGMPPMDTVKIAEGQGTSSVIGRRHFFPVEFHGRHGWSVVRSPWPAV